MKKQQRPDHYSKYTVPPIDSTLMISSFHVFGGELCTVIENEDRLMVALDSTGEVIELVYRNDFNVIDTPYDDMF